MIVGLFSLHAVGIFLTNKYFSISFVAVFNFVKVSNFRPCRCLAKRHQRENSIASTRLLDGVSYACYNNVAPMELLIGVMNK